MVSRKLPAYQEVFNVITEGILCAPQHHFPPIAVYDYASAGTF